MCIYIYIYHDTNIVQYFYHKFLDPLNNFILETPFPMSHPSVRPSIHPSIVDTSTTWIHPTSKL